MYLYKPKSVRKNMADWAFPRTLPTAMVMLGRSVSVWSRTNPGIYTLGERFKSRLRRADLKLFTESACTMLSGRWFLSANLEF